MTTTPRRRARIAALGALVLLAGCGGANPAPLAAPVAAPAPAVAATPEATATPATAPSPTPDPDAVLEPAIVQIENSPEARPQRGLAGADVLYEYSAEGGISRFSALYFRPPAGQVGPVRSARIATVILVGLYDGVLMYSGASTYIEERLRASGDRHYNEDTALGDLFRIHTRLPPHNLYTDGAHIADLLARAGDPVAPYRMWPRLPPGGTPPPGTPVHSFAVPISAFETPVYSWDPAAGGFLRTEPGTGPLLDAGTARPLVAPTVVVMQVPVRPAPEVVDVNGVMGLDHTLTGGGPAQVFTGGMVYAATWQQGGGGPPRLLLAGGAPAPIAPGQVVVELVPTGSPATAH